MWKGASLMQVKVELNLRQCLITSCIILMTKRKTSPANPISDLTSKSNTAATALNETLDDKNLLGLMYKERTSKFRGVNKIKNREMYQAYVCDSKKGRTVYLGRFEKEKEAARAHDLVTLKYWGTSTATNFPISNYAKELETMAHMSEQDCLASIRRSSASFSRGASIFRGVTRHASSGNWQARKGSGKEGFLGTYPREEEAAIAYDVATIRLKGRDALTNFNIKIYNVKAILEGKTEIINKEAVKLLKEAHAISFLKNGGRGLDQAAAEAAGQMNFDISENMKDKELMISQLPSTSEPKAEVKTLEREGSEDLRFQHWSFHSYQPYEGMIYIDPLYGEHKGIPDISGAFQHLSSGPFQPYKQAQNGGGSGSGGGEQASAPWLSSQQPYPIFGSFQPFKVQPYGDGSGFQHASTSAFEPYSRK